MAVVKIIKTLIFNDDIPYVQEVINGVKSYLPHFDENLERFYLNLLEFPSENKLRA